MNKSDLVDALANQAGMTKADAARALEAMFGSGGIIASALKAGTRVQITGFDLGNSPAEYCRSVVKGRGIVMTTTNGTLAIERCLEAEAVLVGSFLNRSSVAREAVLLASDRDVG